MMDHVAMVMDRVAMVMDRVAVVTVCLLCVQLLPQIRMTRSYNQDAANCMFRLVTHGHDDAALEVYLTMEKPSSPEQQGHLGRVLLRNMVLKQRVCGPFTMVHY